METTTTSKPIVKEIDWPGRLYLDARTSTVWKPLLNGSANWRTIAHPPFEAHPLCIDPAADP
jgi:hypothetical protein